jgi:hypothetical protein
MRAAGKRQGGWLLLTCRNFAWNAAALHPGQFFLAASSTLPADEGFPAIK